ncbi:DUF2156 domain-containing protein [Leucobacter viscericola]|uniref:DUF2156 domain-containing protein n=1 Tax=Leucobacter viscericola TaxID=2714935 RepID=A0A6G7XFI3_9MICO|nr:DUF2156 domain-containing protein [Leucobacter viscericola]QIK63138.1 DUF2156 domain-containing protein [Leucobacter viscericola]
MTDVVASPEQTAPQGREDPPRSPNRALTVVRRTPFTITLVVALLAVGITTGTLLSPAADKPWFQDVATGLPSFAEGRWWTILTSPFFVDHPVGYLILAPLVIGGVGWAEWQFGWLRTLGLFVVGHIVGILGAAGIVALIVPTGWPWAIRLSEAYDVGPSCGAFFALVFAIATLPAPWRLRGRVIILVWTIISVLYLGRIYDLEHAVAMAVGLVASGWLPAFRHPAGRPSEREWRLIGFAGLIAIGVIQVLDLVVPFDGPLGQNHPVASFVDVAIDVVVILLIANGVRHGYRIAWIGALIIGSYNVLTAALGVAIVPLLVDAGAIDSPEEVLGIFIAPAVFWVAIMIFIIVGRGAFRVTLRHSRRKLKAETLTPEQTVDRVRRFGGGTISWMLSWPANRYMAVGEGVIGYQAHAGVAIMLGDPITPAGGQSEAFAEFTRVTQQAGLIPCAFSANGVSEQAKPKGWRAVVVAEDTIVDLPGLEFKGKSWNAVRTSINKAGREGITFRMARLADEPWSTLAQVRAISEQWTGDKGLPEMRFTLGTVEEALDPEVYVGLAFDDEGSLHGVTSWLPVYAGDGKITGWTLDLMRRRDGGFGPVMEFLIASSAQFFAEEGYEFVSLSGAPLVRPEGVEAGPVDQVLEQLGGMIEPLYGFKSLHRFKQKFNPRSEPMYLLFRDEGDLPRIGIALTRAYLPDASLRDLVASATSVSRSAS